MACLQIFTCLYADASIRKLPLSSPEHDWMDEQIKEDFAQVEVNGIQFNDFERAWEGCKTSDYCRFQVINSKVYGAKGAIKDLLETMVRNYSVPDVDFIYCYYDCNSGGPIPIFGSAKKRGAYNAIQFVDKFYDILCQDIGWNDHHKGWNELIHIMVDAKYKWPWHQKIGKVFWRGTPSDLWGCGGAYKTASWNVAPRGKCVYLSKYVAPEDIDAAFVPFFKIHNLVDDYQSFTATVPMSEFVQHVDHLRYKYQLNLDGMTATYPGLHWRLLSGCLTFKQETDDEMWYYKGIKPWVHYIPVKIDCSDLIEKIHWAKANDDEAHKIALNAQLFTVKNLMPEHILLYCYKVLLKYASLQKFTPKPYTEFQTPHPGPHSKPR